MLSDWKRAEGKAGTFKYTAGKWSGDPDDKGKVLIYLLQNYLALAHQKKEIDAYNSEGSG